MHWLSLLLSRSKHALQYVCDTPGPAQETCAGLSWGLYCALSQCSQDFRHPQVTFLLSQVGLRFENSAERFESQIIIKKSFLKNMNFFSSVSLGTPQANFN